MKAQEYLQTLDEVRNAVKNPRRVTAEQIDRWLRVADQNPDFWLRHQLAQMLGELYPGKEDWGEIVFRWLIEAAQRRSQWMDELMVTAIRGWSKAFFRSSPFLELIQLHPSGVAAGLEEAIRRRAINPESVPEDGLVQMLYAVDDLTLKDKVEVARLLALTRARKIDWGLKVLKWIQIAFHARAPEYRILVDLFLRGWPNLEHLLPQPVRSVVDHPAPAADSPATS